MYEAALGDLKLGGDFTVEAWVRADMSSFAGARILELGEVTLETMPGSRSVGMQVGKTLVWNWPTLSGERTTHLAAVFRAGKQAALYLDGEARKGAETIDLAALAPCSTLRLGADR